MSVRVLLHACNNSESNMHFMIAVTVKGNIVMGKSNVSEYSPNYQAQMS